MTAHLTRCHCDECGKLDRLPARCQGIPGAFQTTFDHTSHGSGTAAPQRAYFAAKPQSTADSLPLFIGALEPTLF
jgi:hypothetical protein